MLPVFLCGGETWNLRWTLQSFGTRSLRRILGNRWSDFVSNDRLLRETQMTFVTCIVPEHQLRLYGHMAYFPDADQPAATMRHMVGPLASSTHDAPSLRESGEQDQHQENELDVHCPCSHS